MFKIIFRLEKLRFLLLNKCIAFILLAILLIGCDAGPDSKTVSEMFLEKNPHSRIIDIYVGEGDAVAVYYHIKYRSQSAKETKEQVWQYIKNYEGRWVLTHINEKLK